METKTPPPTTIKIVVTAEDIANGQPLSAAKCPIAQALIREGWKDCAVSRFPVLRTKAWKAMYRASRAMINFMSKFDNQQPVKPTQFTMKLEQYLPAKAKEWVKEWDENPTS